MQNDLRQKIQQQIALQNQALDEQQANIQSMQNQPQELDLSSLMALTDAWTGSNFSKTYKRPETAEERRQKAAYLQQGLTGQKSKLLGNEIQLLKALEQNRGNQSLTEGQKAADKSFGKDYQQWVSGGFSNVQGNLEKLQSVYDRIGEKDELGKTILPEMIRARTNPESVEVEQNIGNVVFQSLKEILGGQFTEKEGQRLVQQSYDSRLSDEANQKKVQSSLKTLRNMAEAKQKAAEYFAENGTLKGFPGYKANNMSDFIKELKGKYMPEEETRTYNGVTYKKVGDKWVAQ